MNFKKRVNGSWVDTPYYIHNTSTDTLTTPADIYANDTTATVGLKGDMSQSDTPTPSSPIQPSECGERTGNLFDYQTMEGTIKGCYLDSEGELQPSSPAAVTDYIPCSGGVFTLNKVGGISPSICLYDENKQFLYGKAYSTSGGTDKQTIIVDTSFSASFIRFTYFYTGDSSLMDDLSTIMLNTGSTALPYEPYGIKIPILSNSTTTPVYLGEVETTRRVKKLVLTGDETWYIHDATSPTGYNIHQFYTKDSGINSLQYSSCYSNITQYGMTSDTRQTGEYGCYTVSSGREIGFQMIGSADTIPDVPTWKQYLATQYAAGTPVIIWYVLAEPTTGIVNEPLRKIGDYADTVSGISIPTIAGANTLSIGTTVQPSEVSVNYKGWHPVSAVHEAENGQWD